MMTHNEGTQAGSLKKSVEGYIDRLLLGTRIEAERSAIALGFETGFHLVREVTAELDHWEARGFDVAKGNRGRLTTAEWHRAQCINALEVALGARKFLDEADLAEGLEHLDRYVATLRRLLPAAGPRPTLMATRKAA